MGLSLTVLGCGGTYAGPDNACSGYLLRTATTTVLVDLGSGSLANAQRHIDLTDVDAFVLTHEHPDHWLDLPVARNVYRYVLDRTGVPVFTTAGTQALAVPFCRDATFAWTTIADGDRADDRRHRLRLQSHRPPGRDPGRPRRGRWGLRRLLLGHRAGLVAAGLRHPARPRPARGHLRGRAQPPRPPDGRRGGGPGGCRRGPTLVLTHLLPGTDPARQKAEAEEAFAGPVTVAEPGITFAVEAERR